MAIYLDHFQLFGNSGKGVSHSTSLTYVQCVSLSPQLCMPLIFVFVKGQVYFFVFKGEKFSRYRHSMPILAMCRMIFRYTYNRP